MSRQLGIYCGSLYMRESRYSQRGEWTLKSKFTFHPVRIYSFWCLTNAHTNMHFFMHTVTLLTVHYFTSIKHVFIQLGIGNANQIRNICLCLQ